jgi:hypothetical protein
MKKTTQFVAATLIAIVSLVAVACNKSTSVENGPGIQQVNFMLTDGPGSYDNVFIDIKSLQIVIDTAREGSRKRDTCNWDHIGSHRESRKDSGLVWTTIPIKAGVYDILKFRNGLDTLLASANVPKGSVRLVRIEFGANNSVVKDSVTHPLNLSPNLPNFIVIKLKGREFEEFASRRHRLWLDFDVSRSIIEANGRFYLIPVMHTFVEKNTASVAGKVKPRDAKALITLFNNTDTAYALPNKEGEFKMRGLKDGMYKLFVKASNGYRDTTINNVVVVQPKTTSVGVIELKK